MSEKKLLPKLRFNGFNDGWESTKIDEIAEIVGGGTPKTEVGEYWNGEIKWFTPSEIGKTKYIKDSERHITEKGLKNSSAKLLPANTILLSSRATVGEISIALTECSTNQGFQSLITKNNVDNEFVYYLISTIKNEFIRRASGSTFLEISKNEIKRIPITIPTLSEQKKISNLFSAIDNKIELLEEKHEYYQDFKKFLMQQIFAQKLRFADYSEYTLKQISEKIENGFTGTQVSYETPFPVTRIETISSGKINYDKVGFVDEIPERYLLKEGDILLTNINSMKWIGNSVYYDGKKILYHGMNLMLLRSKNEINSKYLYYYITYNNNWFKKMACQAVNQASINKSTLEKFIVKIPDIETQDNIANLLSFADEKIRETSNQVDLTMKFKKGLLQQMFV